MSNGDGCSSGGVDNDNSGGADAGNHDDFCNDDFCNDDVSGRAVTFTDFCKRVHD